MILNVCEDVDRKKNFDAKIRFGIVHKWRHKIAPIHTENEQKVNDFTNQIDFKLKADLHLHKHVNDL